MSIRTVRRAKTTGFASELRHDRRAARWEDIELQKDTAHKVSNSYRFLGAMFNLYREKYYTLYRGDAKFGREVVMKGIEARDKNAEYEDSFMQGKTDRLYRWKMKNFSNFRREMRDFQSKYVGVYDEDMVDLIAQINKERGPV